MTTLGLKCSFFFITELLTEIQRRHNCLKGQRYQNSNQKRHTKCRANYQIKTSLLLSNCIDEDRGYTDQERLHSSFVYKQRTKEDMYDSYGLLVGF